MKNSNNTGLNWLKSKAAITQTYLGECIKKEFKGKLPHRMVMDIILKGKWDSVTENGQGINHKWYASSENIGVVYKTKLGIVEFWQYEAI